MKNRQGYTLTNKDGRHREIFRKNGVYAMETYIPYTYTSWIIVYFVSGTNGDEYGQFASKAKALIKARKMVKLNESKRKRFDE